MDCIFCKIVKGEIPSYKVYEDDQTIAFLDITPVNPGHTLVISKKHYNNLLDLPMDEANHLINTVKKVAPAIVLGVRADGFNLNLNNGKVAGQVVDHVHFHIVPRFNDDGHQLWHGREYQKLEAESVLKSIKDNL